MRTATGRPLRKFTLFAPASRAHQLTALQPPDVNDVPEENVFTNLVQDTAAGGKRNSTTGRNSDIMQPPATTNHNGDDNRIAVNAFESAKKLHRHRNSVLSNQARQQQAAEEESSNDNDDENDDNDDDDHDSPSSEDSAIEEEEVNTEDELREFIEAALRGEVDEVLADPMEQASLMDEVTDEADLPEQLSQFIADREFRKVKHVPNVYKAFHKLRRGDPQYVDISKLCKAANPDTVCPNAKAVPVLVDAQKNRHIAFKHSIMQDGLFATTRRHEALGAGVFVCYCRPQFICDHLHSGWPHNVFATTCKAGGRILCLRPPSWRVAAYCVCDHLHGGWPHNVFATTCTAGGRILCLRPPVRRVAA